MANRIVEICLQLNEPTAAWIALGEWGTDGRHAPLFPYLSGRRNVRPVHTDPYGSDLSS